MSDSLCVGCGRPPHAGPCYPEITGPLHARIATLTAEVASLKLQLAAAITHPLAVAAVETSVAYRRGPRSSDILDACIVADNAWKDAGYPLRAGGASP